jgi:hypothetical protein
VAARISADLQSQIIETRKERGKVVSAKRKIKM